MAPETLVCAENISPERLSALRDEGLSPAEERKLRAHIATCPACTARLADFDRVASALRAQRELDPGDRILNNVHAALAAPQPNRWRLRPSRRQWTRVATLAPVAAVVLLFVFVFSGLAGRLHPTPSTTPVALAPTSTPSIIPGKTALPSTTPAPVQLPTYSSVISPDAAWGNLGPAASYQTPNVANTQFTIDMIAPDGKALFGTETTNVTGASEKVSLTVYDQDRQVYQPLGPKWTGYSGPSGSVLAASGVYVLYLYNTQPGATCGACHNTLWAYNRMSGATWEVDAGKGVLNSYTSGDYVAFTSADRQVWVADFVTHQTTRFLPDASVRLDGFTWPNVIYEYTPIPQVGGGEAATTLRVANLQTNTTYIMSVPLDTAPGLFPDMRNSAGYQSSIDSAVMSGTRLYATTSTFVNGVDGHGAPVQAVYETLYTISDVTSVRGQITMLARWPLNQATSSVGGIVGANDRLITFRGGYVWDISESKLVFISPLNSTDTPGDVVNGTCLLLTHVVSGGGTLTPVIKADIYITAALPVQ